MGRLVLQETVHNKKWLDISRWNPGLYIIRIGDTRVKKLLVEKPLGFCAEDIPSLADVPLGGENP